MPRSKRPAQPDLLATPAKNSRLEKIPKTRQSRIDRRSRLYPLLATPLQPTNTFQSTTIVNHDGTYNTSSTYADSSPIYPSSRNVLATLIDPLNNPIAPAKACPQNTPGKPLKNDILDLGLPTFACSFCGASFWLEEALKRARRLTNPTFSACCQLGQVDLVLLSPTPPLLDRLLSVHGDSVSKHFKSNIRSYNAAFQWTSFGAKLDPRLLNSRGPYALVLNGENYHYMGSLLPPEGQPPRYTQLYVHDPASEDGHRLASVGGAAKKLQLPLIKGLKEMLDTYNVLAKSFRRVRDALEEPGNENLRLRICGPRVEHGRMYELPTGTELAGLIPGDFAIDHDDRDIIVNNKATGLTRITSLNPLFDSLHFPLLFPHGNDGFHNRIRYNSTYRDPTKKRKYVTQREYYCFRLQYRSIEGKTLIRAGKALQHYCIDAFTTIEQNRLTYLRLNQKKLRSDLYNGLADALHRGDLTANNIGRTINPSSFTGSVRYMQQLYQDAMAVCGEDKPMVIARVFRMRLELLKKDLKKKHYFGRSIADMHTVEFQKRGLPHVHIILWLSDNYKPKTPPMVDKIISAELPDPLLDPVGYESVTKFMLHGPCGQMRPSSPCMKDNKCAKFFPKPFAPETTFDKNGYVTYRRRATNISAIKSGANLDNSYVVPYNRDLVVKYQAHINVEICHKGQLIKYLFKYITKGPDRSEVLAENSQPSEIAQYLDCRSISAYEAVWRLFKFQIHERSTPVTRLSVHLPGEQPITYEEHQSLASIVTRPDIEKTMLTEWFQLNTSYPSARKYTYSDIPQAFVWDKQCSQWTPRKKGFAIGRIYSIPPKSGDTFYLRLLLTKIPGALSYESLRTVNGILYPDYQKACQALGLLSTDEEWNDVMAEMFCNVTSPVTLFEQWWPSMADDFRRRLEQLNENPINDRLNEKLRNQVLHNLQTLLHTYSSTLAQFHLPQPISHSTECSMDDLLVQQLQYAPATERIAYTSSHNALNAQQRLAHDAVLASLTTNKGQLYFLYGHGGTGKTFLYNCIIAKVRSMGQIALVVASSGIAATLLPGGVTAHSRFKIPLDVDHSSTCAIKKGTSLARLIEKTTLIVWDEAPMVHRLSFEALDRTICDLMDTPTSGPGYKPFGGKIVLLGGDFRQTLPVVTNGHRADHLSASLTRSYLWSHCKVLRLHTNMRLNTSTANAADLCNGMRFPAWILALGDGNLPAVAHPDCPRSDWIHIPSSFIIPQSPDPIKSLVARVYPDLLTSFRNISYLRSRAIVAPTNNEVTHINDYILTQLPGEPKVYLSSDTLTTTGSNQIELEIQYPTEFLNGLSFNGMPEHKLNFKPYIIVMLLRNLNPSAGLCNGTRILITHLGNNVIRGLIVGGTFDGSVAIIPRIVLDYTDTNWPFTLKRRQYPLRPCYAMTINKSQGQTLEHIGVYLPTPVFSHGQLYVALSRVRSACGIHIALEAASTHPPNTTRNIVYHEIFDDLLLPSSVV
ncbi:ATP-dependent DNA helicase PIF1 [Linum grandiflorum]